MELYSDSKSKYHLLAIVVIINAELSLIVKGTLHFQGKKVSKTFYLPSKKGGLH